MTSHSGLCIIRAWVELGSSSPLRAQIRLTTDVALGFQRSLTVAEQDEVVGVVQAWLAELLARSPGGESDLHGLSGP